MFSEKPDSPRVHGRPPWQPQVRNPEQYIKSSETRRKRLSEQGHTLAELGGYKKLSETRKKGNYSPPDDMRAKISDSLTGRPQKWQENNSQASCRKAQFNIVYLLKLTGLNGKIFGKWGSTKEQSFRYRVNEFYRKGLS